MVINIKHNNLNLTAQYHDWIVKTFVKELRFIEVRQLVNIIKKKMMYIFLGLFILIGFGVMLYLRQPLFGSEPKGQRLERIKKSPNYIDSAFQNIEKTPSMTEGVTILDGLREVLFNVDKNSIPKDSIPHIPIDLDHIESNENVIIWLGHSSYFVQVEGVKLLVDPVFSNNVSPMPGSARPFKGANPYTIKDIPVVDYLLFTHDHYDHLDYETIKAFNEKAIHVIAPLGVGAHLEYWGYDANKITEVDWDDVLTLKNDLKLTATTARHGSGRKFKRNNTLWTSYVLETSTQKIFLGGDSGYGKHFKEIGKKFGPFDLAILENGQYNLQWKYTHMFPNEVLHAAQDLKAKSLLPVHSGKFRLASHAWNEPLRELFRINANQYQIPLLTPMIGDSVNLKDLSKEFKIWFE